jgi:hypothetical protein
MARIADDLLDCIVYLYPSEAHAADGTAVGGTGFLVQVPATESDGLFFLYFVTNRHVIEGGNTTVRVNKADGSIVAGDTNEIDWILAPNDDLAIYQIGVPDITAFRLKSIPMSMFITPEVITQFDIGPGDETIMVGRFVNAEGRKKNIPTARFGNVAQIANEPLRHRAGFKTIEQESFLVEARSIPGYSGSPVFVHIPPMSVRPKSTSVSMESLGMWLLGVDWAHINDHMPAVNEQNEEMPFKVRANSGMMGVVPAWKLADLINMPALKEKRKNQEVEAAAETQPNAVTPNSATQADAASNRTFKRMPSGEES